MGLKIIEAHDPIEVKTLCMLLYGPPGGGKTSLGYSAHDPLLFDADRGAYRGIIRKRTAQANRWADIGDVKASDLKGTKTLVMDTVGRVLDLLSADIAVDPKKTRGGGALSQSGYGDLKVRFYQYLNMWRDLGMDIVLIAHSTEENKGDDIIERIDATGSSKQEIYKSADVIGRLGFVGNDRVINFSPTETRFGKDPAALGQVTVPNLVENPEFLGDLIDQIKASLNARTAKKQTQSNAVAEWTQKCREADADGLTTLAGLAPGKGAKSLLLKIATERGFTYDKALKKFLPPAVEAEVGAADDEYPF